MAPKLPPLAAMLSTARGDRPQHELATEAGVTQKTISKWEAGKAIPRPRTWKRAATAYRVSFDELSRKALKALASRPAQ